MNPRSILLPLLGLALAGSAWALRPSDTSASAGATPTDVNATRVRTAGEEGRPDDNASPDDARTAGGRPEKLQASRDAIMDALHDQLDALDAEVGLDDAQRDRLETVLTEERTRGFEALDGLRRGPGSGQRPPDGKVIAATMQASRTQADTEARAALDDTQYAAWLRIREPTPRR
ncbi:MAG: hypothetical protein Q8P41_28760 [Pseudomonadota bacterium]|nr:hypothetical protein [Pseudomonadota bacterium]